MKTLRPLVMAIIMAVTGTYMQGASTLALSEAEGTPGQSVTVRVSLANDVPLRGLQVLFDVPPGSGLTASEASAQTSGHASGMSASAGIRDGRFSLMIFSTGTDVIPAGDGLVASFAVTMGDTPLDYKFTPVVKGVDESGDEMTVLTSETRIVCLKALPAFSSTTVDFGRVPLGSVVDRELEVRNDGTASLTISSLDFSAPEFSSDTALPTVIPPGGQKCLNVRYSPEVRGRVSEKVTVDWGIPGSLNYVTLDAVPYSVNTLRVSDVSCVSGDEATLALVMENMDPVNGFTLDFSLPEEVEYIADSFALSDRKANHLLSVGVEGQSLKATAYSIDNTPFVGGNGEIATFRVRVHGKNTVRIEPSKTVLAAFVGNEVCNVVSDVYPGTVSIKYPTISLANAFDMGRTPITERGEASMQVSNYGNAPLVISRVTVDSPRLLLNEEFPLTIGPWETVEISLAIDDLLEGELEGFISVYSNDPDRELVTVTYSASRYAPNYMSFHCPNVDKTSPEAVIEVSLDNYDEVCGLQFDITHPSGMLLSDAFMPEGRGERFTMARRAISPTVDRCFIYSLHNDVIEPGSGLICTIPIVVDSTPEAGTYSFTASAMKISNPALEDRNSELGDISFTLLYDPESGINGIEADDSNIRITGGCISIVGLEDSDEVRIFGLEGTLIGAERTDCRGCVEFDNLPGGVYILTTGKTTVKCVVPF